MKCEEKIPGGKMVCLELWQSGGRVSRARITGDFFLHPEDAISRIERDLVGIPLSAGEGEIAFRIRESLGDALLIGATPEDLSRMFRKAVG
ncbi:MAG: biotin--protein ligase [Candidatus Micrarchaeia archaeon]